jgi:flagellar motor protein MotB
MELVRAALVALCVAACAASGPASLDRARALRDEIVARDDVATHAPVELYEAEKAIDVAERALDAGESGEEVAHLAYLAERRFEIARETAREQAAARRAVELAAERREILLLARARRGERATEAAEQARVEALARAAQVERELESALSRAIESDRARQRALERASQAERERLGALEQAERAEWARQRVEETLRQQPAPAARAAEPAKGAPAPVFEEVLDDLHARESEGGLVLTLQGELLPAAGSGPGKQAPDALALGPGARRLLRPVAGFLREHAHWQVRIEGFGPDPGLAQARAQAVGRFLEEEGLRGAHVSVPPPEAPASATPDVASRPPGERVEIVMLDPGAGALDAGDGPR